jgi:hypothetical protein
MRRYLIVFLVTVSANCGLAELNIESPRRQDVHTDGANARFCLVPVKDGAPTEADIGQTWRLSIHAFRIPGIAALVFTPANRRGQWTIDADRRLVPYNDSFPRSSVDKNRWVTESWSARTVAITWRGGVSVLRPGHGRFEALEEDNRPGLGSYIGIQTLPRRKLTIIVTAIGFPLVVEENSLRSWLSQAEMIAHGIRGIYGLYDVPSLAATIIIDLDHRIHVLTDDDKWQQVGSIGADESGRVFEIPNSHAALFIAAKSVVAVRRIGETGDFSAETLSTTDADGAGARYLTTKLFGQVLTYDSGGHIDSRRRWRRLEHNGFEDISGGDVGNAHERIFPHGRIHDLPTINRVLIEGGDRLFIYDGQTFSPVIDGWNNRIGDFLRVYDLQSIKRVIITSRNGMFELTADGRLVSRLMPFPTDGLPEPEVADWPESAAALVATRNGLFALDADLNAIQVSGGDQIGLGWLGFANGTNPGTGEMVLTGSRGLFLAVDARRSPDTCRRAGEVAGRISESDICLVAVPSTRSDDIGFAVGPMIEAPEVRGILFDTVRGIFLLSADHTITRLQDREGQFTRSLTRLPWSDEVLSGIDSVIGRDLSITQISWHQYHTLLGVFPSIRAAVVAEDSDSSPPAFKIRPPAAIKIVQFDTLGYQVVDTGRRRDEIGAIVDAPWFGKPVVANTHGLFTLDRAGALAKLDIDGLSRHSSAQHSQLDRAHSMNFFSVPRYQTIYLWKNEWFRITSDRRWLPVTGLPPELAVLAVYDPGAGDALFGTTAGIFAVSLNGVARQLAGEAAPRRAIRTFSLTGNARYLFAGGDEGLFEIQTDSMVVHPMENGTGEDIGSVQGIIDVSFAGISIVEASNGTFALEGGQLHSIRDLSAASATTNISVFHQMKRVMVKKRVGDGPLLYEIARRNSQNVCASPIARR